MVAFHYPPIAGSAGALRTRAFASYLPRSGWHPHVLVPSTRAYTDVDISATPASDANVYRAWAVDAQRHLGWRGRYPELAAIPDRWAAWAPAAIAKGLAIIRRQPIEVIWSTYPIATSHLIASTLSRLTGLPWVAEFRDPVSTACYPRLQRWAQQAIERRTIARAHRTVFVTPGALNDCRQRFVGAAGRLSLIPNGYDEELEPADTADRWQPHRSGPIRLLHSGHLYRKGRNPSAFLMALERLRQRDEISAGDLEVVFRNSQEDALYREEIDRRGLGDMVSLAPRISHGDALQEQRSVDGLLLLQGAEFNRQVPAKLFEYLRSRRPVLALVDEHGDTATVLDELGGARQAAADDPLQIANAVRRFISELRNIRDNGPGDAGVDEDALANYSRQRQTAALAALLAEAAAGGSPGRSS